MSCSVPDCGKPVRTLGMCSKHYVYAWRSKNPDRFKEHMRRYKSLNQEKIKKLSRKYNKEYSQSHKEQAALYNRKRYRSFQPGSPVIIAKRLRTRLYLAIRKRWKSGSAIRDLGCSVPELKKHLEARFQPGMTWENWGRGLGKWNIDHVVPLAAFDLTDRDQLLKAVHYSNLQPLWAEENLSKSDRF